MALILIFHKMFWYLQVIFYMINPSQVDPATLDPDTTVPEDSNLVRIILSGESQISYGKVYFSSL